MQVLARDQIQDDSKWRLEDIVENDTLWEEKFALLSSHKTDVCAYDGKLNDPDSILACLRTDSGISCELTRLYVYARMRQDQDLNVSKYQSMCDRIENLSVEIGALTSFVRPQLTANSEEFLLGLIDDPRFADYDYTLKEIARNKKHVLSEGEEKLMAQVGMFGGLFHDAFNMFDNADVKFAPFIDSKGEEVRLSHGLYGLYLQSHVREDRQKAFDTMFGTYRDMIHTLSVLYAGNVKKDCFYAKARKYDSCLQKAVNDENVPEEIYRRLIECVHDNLDALHTYLGYRKKTLGYDELHMYDLHVPLVESGEIGVPYEEARQIVKRALTPLGKEYAELLDRAFGERWIDVYENKGKRSGAYSWGCYGCHPYVLLNYQPVTHDVFTIAHELGHAMHTYYSNQAQPYEKADYEIFVAEVASTVNETLLLLDLSARTEDPRQKKFLLSYLLDMFRTTVFRQTQFAEFEAIAHEMAERGESLTADALCDRYYELNGQYYGKEVVNDDAIRYEWARIPHFYRSFYVYKYATGLISAVCIARRILREGESAVADYKKFLSAGGSMPPAEILKLAGVDLTSDEPYRSAMEFFKETLDQLQKLD